MPLTDIALKALKPKDKPYKVTDEKGLYIHIMPTGSKLWRFKYRFQDKEGKLSFGAYPEITLAKAREKRDEARRLIAEGINPAEQKKTEKERVLALAANSFEVLCREWLEHKRQSVEEAQYLKAKARLEKDVLPWLGKYPMTDITAPMILDVMRRIDSRGARYTAHKVRSEISQCFRYAIATARAERDPCPDLRGAIPAPKEKHMPALTDPKDVAELLRAIEGFRGSFPVLCALKLAPLLFCRPGELRSAEWAHIDLEAAEWRYTVSKTKTDHLVPLATQAVVILKELHPLTGHGRYLFPGARDAKRPMSDAAINAALRRLGYDTRTHITGHGFRAMARTLLAEKLHQKPEIIEHQLAHSVPDALGTAYNRTRFIDDRRIMMQLWADYLDELRTGGNVVAFREVA